MNTKKNIMIGWKGEDVIISHDLTNFVINKAVLKVFISLIKIVK
jgi:hypothetical protein